MGSFLARSYAVRYLDIDGLLLSGSSAGNQPLALGKAVASFLGKIRGIRHRSKMLFGLSFAGYNRAFSREKDILSWLSSSSTERTMYRKNQKCNFVFTVSAFRELYKLLGSVSTAEWVEAMPQSLPVFLISGACDPLGENGDGIQQIYTSLEDHEVNELRIKIYPEARHQILRDPVKDEVFPDIASWVKEVAEGVVACRSFEGIPFGRVE